MVEHMKRPERWGVFCIGRSMRRVCAIHGECMKACRWRCPASAEQLLALHQVVEKGVGPWSKQWQWREGVKDGVP